MSKIYKGNKYGFDNPRFRTEFTIVNDLQTGESYTCGRDSEYDAYDNAEILCTLLNSLYDKILRLEYDLEQRDNYIMQLQKKPKLYDVLGDAHIIIDENKELKLELQRLYNYFEDYLEDEMSPNSFSEMWDFVRKDKQWENKVKW